MAFRVYHRPAVSLALFTYSHILVIPSMSRIYFVCKKQTRLLGNQNQVVVPIARELLHQYNTV